MADDNRDIRTEAKKWIEDNMPPFGQDVYSDLHKKKFYDLTNVTHEELVAQWKTREGKPPAERRNVPLRTTCNEFVARFSLGIGLENLGRFDIKQHLEKVGKKYAWISASDSSQPRPRFGDIFFAKGTHVGVSLDFAEDIWYTAEGGQGGPVYDDRGVPGKGIAPTYKLIGGHDIVKRKMHPDPKNAPPTGPFDRSKLDGWVDIELFAAKPASQTVEGAVDRLQQQLGPWINMDGGVVHPDAPNGGRGPGYFRAPGSVRTTPFGLPELEPRRPGIPADRLPNPWSPAMTGLDPLAIQRIRQFFEYERYQNYLKSRR